MTSYHVTHINGYGPYLRKATYVAPGQKEWEHIGPVHSVDPETLPDSTVAEIREEGHGLARFRDGEKSELHRLNVANEVRNEIEDRWGDVLASTDDRRLTVVELDDDAPRAAQRVLAGHAESMEAEVNAGSGQAALTKAERDSIDWSKPGQNIPHARAAKAALADEGISDWQALYSGDIESDGWGEVADNNRESMSGDRLDNNEGPSSDTISQQQADSEIEREAVKYAVEGDEDAEAALINEFGWTADEIEMERAR